MTATRKKKHSILFICLGNICRSPAAEGIMQSIVRQNHRTDDFLIDSAGIGSWHVGQLPDRRMRTHGANHGYDFSSRARQFSRADFSRFDLIVTMDEENFHHISAQAQTEEERRRVVRMTSFLTQHPGQNTIPDPYYGGPSDFELVISLLEDACQGLYQSIVGQE